MVLFDAVPVLDGATVVVARDGERGMEVLLLRRHRTAVFVPGAHCFPGGRVDPGDGGDPKVAALRETFEEAGLLLGAPGPVAAGFDGPRWRADVYAGRASIDAATAAAGLAVDLDALRLLARWVTPPGEARRFDCRFYVAPAPDGQVATHNDDEHDQCDWWRPADAVEAGRAGDIVLIQPTMHTVETIGRFDTVASLLGALDAADPDDRIVEADNGWRVRLPFDEAVPCAG